MLAVAIITAATIPLAPFWLLASKKQKKKNNGDKQIKKRNNTSYFIAINVVKEKDDNDKEKIKARILTKIIAAIATAILKISDIYKNNA